MNDSAAHGIYSTAANAANKPVTSNTNDFIITFGGSSVRLQFYFATDKIFYRKYVNGSFQSWIQVL